MYNLDTLIDEIIELIKHKQTSWEGHDVIMSIPILFCGWLYYQCLYKDNGEYKLTSPNKVNLFRKGYYVYNHIWNKLTNNVVLDVNNRKYYENKTKEIIIKLIECGMNGKACSYKFIRGINIVHTDKIYWSNDGYLYVDGYQDNLMEWLK